MAMQRWRRERELIPWRPIREIDQISDEMERHFEDVFGRPFFPVAWKRASVVCAGSLLLEVSEKEVVISNVLLSSV